MKKVVKFPAIFEVDAEDPKYINVCIPDILGAYTFGEGMEEAMYMAKDLLKTMVLEAPAQCSRPHSLEETQKNFLDKQVMMVEVEIEVRD